MLPRVFAAAIALLVVALAAAPANAVRPRPVSVSIATGRPGPTIAPDFVGLSFEAGSLPQLSAQARGGNLIALLGSISPGVLRFGGSSLDSRTAWSSDGSGPSWATTLITPADLQSLAAIARATGWSVLLGVDLAHYDPQSAGAEAQAAQGALGGALRGIEIGNEPNALAAQGWRTEPWGFDEYQQQADAYRLAIADAAPGVALAGPDVSSPVPLDWVTAEALDEAPALLTAHYYSGSCEEHPLPTLAKLMSKRVHDSERAALTALARISAASGIPLRLDEANNIACGGLAGVSNTFGAALWALDYLLRAMRAGVAGVNFHDTLVCGGYSPLCIPSATTAGNLVAQPEWYALLLAGRLGGERLIAATARRQPQGTAIGAFLRGDGRVDLLVVDERPLGAPTLDIRLAAPARFKRGTVLRLTAPSLYATTGVDLGGASVGGDGRWQPARPLERIGGGRRPLHMTVRPSTAALVTLVPAR